MNLLKYNDFVNKVLERYEVKRKYTDSYPNITKNLKTKVRNLVLLAIADKVVTEDELLNIIQYAGSKNIKTWLKQNGEYFKLVKGDTNSAYFKLTKRALKILTNLNFI